MAYPEKGAKYAGEAKAKALCRSEGGLVDEAANVAAHRVKSAVQSKREPGTATTLLGVPAAYPWLAGRAISDALGKKRD